MSAVKPLKRNEPGPLHHPAGTGSPAPLIDVRLEIHHDLPELEREWRAFEQEADSTAFQSFAWLATWQRYVGSRQGVLPVIVIGRDGRGNPLFVLPFAISRTRFARRLTWLGSDLCDYNAPLLASGVSARLNAASFMLLWQRILQRLRREPHLQFDLIDLEKMPEQVGSQRNPMCWLRLSPHRSGAYLTRLGSDWTSFYKSKRSTQTRARDRNKRRKLAEIGEVQTVTPHTEAEITRTLDALIQQKARFFARIGLRNIFERPGYTEFFRELATSPSALKLVHVSRLEVGDTVAAANFGLIFHGCYYHVLASFDDGELSRFGPGVAHLHDLLCYAIERGCSMFDFTIGDEQYKRDWCDARIDLYDHVGIGSLRGALTAAALVPKRQLQRWIKQSPLLWTAFSRLRARWGALRLRGRATASRP